MKNKEYWTNRFLALETRMHDKAVDYYHELESEYQKAIISLEKDISRWYIRLGDNNEITYHEARKLLSKNELKEFKWTVEEYIKYGKENEVNQHWVKQLENASAKVHISRLEALKVQLQNQVEVLMGNEADGISRLMENVYTESYYRTAFEIQKIFGVGSSFMALDYKLVQKVLSKPWATDGINFSERIWGRHRPQLVQELYTQLTQALIRGDNPKKCVNILAKRFSVSKSRAENLIFTEAAFFRSAGQKETLSNLNAKKYEICATLDSRTSNICRGLDGKIFDLNEYQPGVTAPPFHNRCRSTTCPYFNDEFTVGEMRAARDDKGKTYYVPADIKYEDWKDTFVLNPQLSQELYDLKADIKDFKPETYKNIWKEDVTTLDYKVKKDSISAKQKYFKQKIETTSGTEQEKFKVLLSNLEEFETQGKAYYEKQDRIKKLQNELTKLRDGDIIKENPYTQERKDAAYWFTEKEAADLVLRPPTGELWKVLSAKEKEAAYRYTSGSGGFNRPLRGYDRNWNEYIGIGKVSLDNEGCGGEIEALKKALAKSSYDFDLWLQRGIETTSGAAEFLGISQKDLINCAQEELEELLLDKVVKDEAFVSTAACKGAGFDGYIFNIYAPAGTNMLYAEPFSRFGNGAGVDWDGETLQESFGNEFEVILQCGYEFKIKKIEKSTYGKTYIDLEVVIPE